ncbi:MAG TPA: translation initiation factor IF-2 [Acholeplasmataceae bacterium]|jgi:translation initiation factor IF-2|nr:translation initiation factor IF-2 [Acholeplasmataceae bacterium]
MQKKNTKRVNKSQPKEKKFIYKDNMKLSEVAEGLDISSAALIKKLINLGIMSNVNQVLERDVVELIVDDYGYTFEVEKITDLTRYDEIEIKEDPKDLVSRPAIVTVMGHVDHGKTTLLDTIRKTRVAQGEAGGITQHIGAYQVKRKGSVITFIDTPGHAAFTEMRARGAKVTDIVILVVAADDGVMPQTIEAIDHAKAAKVPLIVAVNKIDKPTANPERVMTALSERGVLAEVWGGDVPFVNVSALKNQGIDDLLDVVELVAEIAELKANPNRLAIGTVIESRLDRGRGPVATIIIEQGTLKVGDNFVIGTTFGRIRTIHDDLGRQQKQAKPSQPVEITGLNDVPMAGDMLMVFPDERTARQIAEERAYRERENQLKGKRRTLDSLFGDMEAAEKELNLIIKADVQGSTEALTGLLEKIDIEGFHCNIIRSNVGAITENDIILAEASNAIVIGFNVRPTAAVRALAEEKGIEIRLYSVIYKVQEDIIAALEGMLEPEMEEQIIGQAEVRNIFKISKIGTIAGCYVTDGVIERDSLVRVIRDSIVVYEGKLSSLKRFKDDARSVRAGYECGIGIQNYNDIKVGDIIEASKMKEVE